MQLIRIYSKTILRKYYASTMQTRTVRVHYTYAPLSLTEIQKIRPSWFAWPIFSGVEPGWQDILLGLLFIFPLRSILSLSAWHKMWVVGMAMRRPLEKICICSSSVISTLEDPSLPSQSSVQPVKATSQASTTKAGANPSAPFKHATSKHFDTCGARSTADMLCVRPSRPDHFDSRTSHSSISFGKRTSFQSTLSLCSLAAPSTQSSHQDHPFIQHYYTPFG